MKLAALCDQDTAVGLRLSGIHEIFVVDKDNSINLWNQISEKDDIGVLFVTEKIAEDIGKYMKDYRLRNNLPIIVEIPDKKGRITDHVNFISNLIKKAVGIEIKK